MEINRRTLLQTAVTAPIAMSCGLAAKGAFAKDVSWLEQVQRPPEVDLSAARKKIGALQPLLIDNQGKEVRSRQAWEKYRAKLLAKWQSFLGPMPPREEPVKWTVKKQDQTKDFTRKLIRYNTEPGVSNEAYLLEPKNPAADSQPLPAIVALHQTSRQHIHEVAGVTGPKAQHLGPELCRLGFVVVCPKNYLWHETKNYLAAVERFKKRRPRTLGMHKMLYDAIRGVDVLRSLPFVDKNRIGTVGHSLGAKEVLYLMAFDPRVKAGVASEGGLTFRSTNWDAPWYLGKGIYQKGFKLNHHQLLALAAPRSLLVLAGEKGRGAADGNRSWPLIETALPVYRLYGKKARLGIYNHGQGHSIPPLARRYMQQWLQAYV